MGDKKVFQLPDLGEGLPDATIVEWYVKEGDTIRLDDNLVSMETAKAVVDVPSPVSGKVLRLAGGAGDVIVTGAMLAEFEIDPSQPQRAEGQDTGHHHGAPAARGVGAEDPASDARVVASSDGGAIRELGATVSLGEGVRLEATSPEVRDLSPELPPPRIALRLLLLLIPLRIGEIGAGAERGTVPGDDRRPDRARLEVVERRLDRAGHLGVHRVADLGTLQAHDAHCAV